MSEIYELWREYKLIIVAGGILTTLGGLYYSLSRPSKPPNPQKENQQTKKECPSYDIGEDLTDRLKEQKA